MRPKLFTLRNALLTLLVVLGFGGMVLWLQSGGKVAFLDQVPSTAGKIAFQRGDDIYMADGTAGTNAVLLTTDGRGADAEPAWSPNGETIALTSDRNGVTRQLYLMNAVPGATVAARSNSSTTKEAPRFGAEGDIYFLDSGRISKLTPKTADVDAVFPTAEQKHEQKPLAELFAGGGITRFVSSPDGSRFFAVVKREEGQALVVYVPDEKIVVAFGTGEEIRIAMADDGKLVVAISGGEPFPKPIALSSPQIIEALTQNAEMPPPTVPAYAKNETSTVFTVDAAFAIKPVVPPVPFAPSGLTVSRDGARMAFTSVDKMYPGVFVIPLDGTGTAGPITNLPASEPAFSPDGARIAFVSGTDIYVAGTSPGGNTAPANLTKGQGTNSSPTWSPATAKK